MTPTLAALTYQHELDDIHGAIGTATEALKDVSNTFGIQPVDQSVTEAETAVSKLLTVLQAYRLPGTMAAANEDSPAGAIT